MKANMEEGRLRKADTDWRASWRRWEEFFFFFCSSPDILFFFLVGSLVLHVGLHATF